LRRVQREEKIPPFIKGGRGGIFSAKDFQLYSKKYVAKFMKSSIDKVAKSRKSLMVVIPAEAGIQRLQVLMKILDTGFHR
jgi:hypothetical protein